MEKLFKLLDAVGHGGVLGFYRDISGTLRVTLTQANMQEVKREVDLYAFVKSGDSVLDGMLEQVQRLDDSGYVLVMDERKRQILEEGFTLEADKATGFGLLRDAAICYMGAVEDLGGLPRSTPVSWPFSPEWWKPAGRVRNLAKAGALFLAAAEVIKDRPLIAQSLTRLAVDCGVLIDQHRRTYND